MSNKNTIDVARAQIWVKDVQQEVIEVEAVLTELRQKCWEDPNENDVLYKLLSKTGNILDDTWSAATVAYKNAWGTLEESIDAFQKLGDKIEDIFSELTNNLK